MNLPSRPRQTAAVVFVLLPYWLSPALAGGSAGRDKLAELSLEQLMQIEVTSVARKEQKLSKAPAAVYVVTREDIRRSGHASVPDLLRMVPGLHVAQIDAHTWAITSRGFNSLFASKVLVLIDGRSVYTPLFSGVYWEMHDLLLEDIERIEVIRGPGATMWGANAVNGVVNIVTRKAKDTQGGIVDASAGNVDLASAGIRYGGRMGGRGHYRIYSKFGVRDDMRTPAGNPSGDGWSSSRSGARLDWELSSRDALTVIADLFRADIHQVMRTPMPKAPYDSLNSVRYDASAGNILARFERQHRNGSISAVQFYFDHYDKPHPVMGERRDTADFELQNRFAAGGSHDLTWGLGYRFSSDATWPNAFAVLRPASKGLQIFSAFLQDEVKLRGEEVVLTLGSKFERNDFTGFEVQPTARLLWELTPSHTLWTAASRAVRTPSRGDRHGNSALVAAPGSAATGGLPTLIRFAASPEYGSQVVNAYEAGYRTQVRRKLTFDLASFYNRYGRLRLLEPGALSPILGPEPFLDLPYYSTNRMSGKTWGAEAVVQWEPLPVWKLTGTYSRMAVWLAPARDASPLRILGEMGRAPENQFSARSYLDLPAGFQLDGTAYFTSGLQPGAQVFPLPEIPSWLRIDIRLAWQPRRDVELSVGGRNSTDSLHPEFTPEVFTQRSEIRRGFYGRIRWHF
ncbi:MAG: TonB-dependent receptor [Bryobacteraceae bacterium]|nr:TonB-dependent receptor [Bryobacteraceae bacterium]